MKSAVSQKIVFSYHSVDVLRLDQIHPYYGGNKYFKLKHNLQKAKDLGQTQILTFGGAHSNHIYSTAAICKEHGLRSVGVIRGEESGIEQSPTLQFALDCGMKLHFVSREEYNKKTNDSMTAELRSRFGDFYLVPEGGSNYEGVKGCTEILTDELKKYDYVFCACGTASTYSGLKISAAAHQKVIGISVLKGENKLVEIANGWLKSFEKEEIKPYEKGLVGHSTIVSGYHFEGYAKFSEELKEFKLKFERRYSITLDHIYTAKLFYAVFDLIKQNKLTRDSSLLVVHSGGLQGNAAFEKRFGLV